jgi:tRNA G10  N-methylase Trm11
MTNSILTTVYLKGVMQLTKDVELQDFLGEPRHQIWMITKNNDFDKILMQRIYKQAINTIKHFEEGHYISSIVMCGGVAEMLTYFLFFIHTNSKDILSNNSDVSDIKYHLIKHRFTDAKFKKSFGKKGGQTDKIKILSESKITKKDYGAGGEGHDIKEICRNLKEINEIRIRYFHHWFDLNEELVKNEARNCIKSLYKAIGYIFEYDFSNNPGVLMINESVNKWIVNLFKNNL